MFMIKIRRLPFIVGGLIGLIVIFSKCVQSGSGAPGGDPRGVAYAGMTACLDCHKGIGGSYLHAAHAMTSRVADAHTVDGPFVAPWNEFVYRLGRKVVMERRDSGLFQVAVTPYGQEEHRFEIAVGSGRKAQTYEDSAGRYIARFAAGPATTDVHGNQYELLAASQCFLRSATLECGSCHDPHVRERDSLTGFATRCMNCHGKAGLTGEHASMPAAFSAGLRGPGVDVGFLARNCIDCHMPAKASEAITMLTQQQRDPVADLVRTHLIAIYPTEAKKRLADWRADQSRRGR